MSRYFVKFLIGEWKTTLRIPQLFVFSFSLTPKAVTLINASSKNLWTVDMEQVEEDPTELYFKKGWSKFVKDNALMADDCLIFKFDGDSTFKVVICGKSSCDKMLESRVRTQVNQKKYHKQGHNNNEKRASSTQDCGENQKGKDLIHEISDKTWDEKEEGEEVNDEFGDINSEPHDAIMNIGEGSSLAIIPSFRIKLNAVSKNGKGAVCIPTDFFRKYMRKEKHEVEMETVEGVWKVASLPHLKRSRMFARFTRGWSEFARQNRLQAGETLRFRMIRRGHCPKFTVSKEQ
ncbi:hypothetical protein QN277_019799 [Acacia crassicarpa]|uniref:TF-B3 domain-containing protein n=1 Tax=Acacia crassicarpa TaxID=499986 RepID=A0AAE1JID4_9FABA|nr:hypothetical protein QN277_019799 [Acacia crassicarpa]